ncbi:moubatin-like [Ornithodoros turicata]|uniref:moubatin-like n=1 Tax=Ornithodoros turicata TaxID=34597 RepID=UPI00313A3F7A
MVGTPHVLFVSLCLLGGVALAEKQCDFTGTPDAWNAITKPGSGVYRLQLSTQENPKDCLRGKVPKNPTKPNATIKMTYKDKDGQWQSNEWQFYTSGPNITATLGDRTLTGTVIFDDEGKCHVNKYPDGAYGLWKHSSAQEGDAKCCKKKFKKETKSKNPQNPQKEGCSKSTS